MTLNVIIQNFVAVDSEVSIDRNRTSDDVEKSEIFDRKNYCGVLIGNGAAKLFHDAVLFVRNSDEPDFETLLKKLEGHMESREAKRYENFLHEQEEKIRAKHRPVSDVPQKEGLIHKEFAEIVDRLYTSSPNGNLYFVVSDKKSSRLCKYILPITKGAKYNEIDLFSVVTDGSGADIAGAYLATQTSGINWEKLPSARLFYLTTLACAVATANRGVGGLMRVIDVNVRSARYLPDEKVNAAVRICAKQVAGDLSKKEATRLVQDLYQGKPDYVKTAARLDMSVTDLKYAPCQIHQDVTRFNRTKF